MPNYTSSLARSLGRDVSRTETEGCRRYSKRQSHRIERLDARWELGRVLDDSEAFEAFTAAQHALEVEAMEAFIDHEEDDIWASLMAEPDVALWVATGRCEPDEVEALAWEEAGWGEQRFDPADVQWGFRVTDRP